MGAGALSITRGDRDAMLLLAAQVYYKLAGLATLAVVGRYIDDAHIGVYFVAAGYAPPLLLLAHLGTTPLIGRRVAAAGEARAFFPFLGLRAVSAVGFFIALVAAAILFAGPTWRVVIAMGAVAWVESAHGAFASFFIALRRVHYNVIVGVAAQTVLVGSVLGLVTLSPTIDSLVAADGIRAAFLLGGAAYVAHTRIAPLRASWDPTIIREGLPFMAQALGTAVLGPLVTVAIGHFGSYGEAAQFGLAVHIVRGTLFIPGVLGAVVARELASEGVTRHTRFDFIRQLAILAGFAAAGTGILCLFPAELPALLYGSRHRDLATLLLWMAALIPLWHWTSVAAVSLQAVHRERLVTLSTYVSGILSLVLVAILVPDRGAVGGAMALLAAAIAQAAILTYGAFRVGLLRSAGPVPEPDESGGGDPPR